MSEYLADVWENFLSVLNYISIIDVFDILLLSVVVFLCLKLMKKTRAEQLMKGIIVLSVILFLLDQFQFKAMGLLAETFFSIGILAVIVLFQPEFRRILERVGRTKMKDKIPFFESMNDKDEQKITTLINSVSAACENLSKTKTGALIVIERETKLGEQIETGTLINAEPSVQLFGNIFVPNTPLHDGAVIIRDYMIHAAACYLPKPAKEDLVAKELGTRHRAAIGMSEVSDAIVVVVSEETGTISIAEDGVITRNFSGATLSKFLSKRLLPEKEDKNQKDKRRKKPSKNQGKGVDAK